jgi:L-ascorbate metabolism protein UlaG (beta-lactamase superfamily)
MKTPRPIIYAVVASLASCRSDRCLASVIALSSLTLATTAPISATPTAMSVAAANMPAAVIDQNLPPALDVTYLANEGFLFEAGGKKVLIDALFVRRNEKYAWPATELIQQMTLGRSPFDRVDLLLVSHHHNDHFAAIPVAAFLRNHSETLLIAHRQVVDGLRATEGFSSFADRVREIHLEPGNSTHLDINGIPVDLVCLYHAGGPRGATKNLAFSVDLGGIRFFHLGDAAIDQNVEEFKAFRFEDLQTDVLFVEYFDCSPQSQSLIRERIKPGHIVAMHAPPAEFAISSESFRSVFPAAILFEKSMERRRFVTSIDSPKSAGGISDVMTKVKAVAGEPLEFRTEGLAMPKDVLLAPFYSIHKQRYAVYWRLMDRTAYDAGRRSGAEKADGR